MGRRYTTRTPFDLRSRRVRKRAFMSMRNRIERSAPVLGGKFTTHDYMHGENGWIDAHFFGHQAPVLYSLALQTTAYAYKELVRERAWDKSYELVPEHESSLFANAVKDPITGGYRVPHREPRRYAELNGQTRLDWAQAQHKTIADSGEIQVFEEWTLHRNYHRGIGLHATIDVPYLTIDAVNAFIDRFLIQEANFRDPAARTYRYEQISHWGLESNALIEPWEWDSVLQRQASLDEPIKREDSGESKDVSK